MRTANSLTLAALVLGLLGCSFDTTNSEVDKANEAYSGGSFTEAASQLEALREKIPEKPELHFDLGTALLAAGEFEKAETAFLRALEKADQSLTPRINANLGLAYLKHAGSLEDKAQARSLLKQAVDTLQAAVGQDPTLVDAARNLELALLQYAPPCERRQEPFEPNDSRESAREFTPEVAGTPLLLCPDDKDFYRIAVAPGQRLLARLTPQVVGTEALADKASAGGSTGIPGAAAAQAPSGAGPGAAAPMAGAAAAGPGGQALPGVPGGGPDQAPAAPAAPQGPPPPGVTLEVLGPTGEVIDEKAGLHRTPDQSLLLENTSHNEVTWTLAVRPSAEDDDGEHPYGLSVQLLEPCKALEDPAEENDTADQAGDLPQGQGTQLRLCPMDDDWFKLALEPHQSLMAQFQGQMLLGEPSVEILDRRGRVLSRSQAAGDKKEEGEGAGATALLLDADGGDYFLRISSGAKGEGQGTLAVSVHPPCPEGDDQSEDNDEPDKATVVQKGGQPLLLRSCPGDPDWLKLELPKGEAAEVQVAFEHEKGDLQVEAFDKVDAETPVVVSNNSSKDRNGEGVRLAAKDQDTSFYIKVSGVDQKGENFYQVEVKEPKGGGDNQNQDQQDQQDQQDRQDQKNDEPIDAQMNQLDQQKRPNLEALDAIKDADKVMIPGGKTW